MLWKNIYGLLFNELTRGLYAKGSRFPTEAQLSTRFRVNRHTIRRALKKLSSDGLIYSRQGAGVFVTTEPMTYRFDKKTRFSTHITETSKDTTLKLLFHTTRPSNKEEAKKCGIKEGQLIHHIEGIRERKELPLMHFTSFLPAKMVPDFIKYLLLSKGISKALKKCGVSDYSRLTSKITAVSADSMIANILMVDIGSPILQVHSTDILNDGSIIECGNTLMAADRISIKVEFEQN